MTLTRSLTGILLCLTFVACGDSSAESAVCLEGEPCSKTVHELALDPNNTFEENHGIIPDVTPDLVRNLSDDEETDTESSTIEDEIVAECSAASEEVIQDCERAKRSAERCELRGLWLYSGCKLELIQSRLNAE